MLIVFCGFLYLSALYAGERAAPAVFYIAVDTSLSVGEKQSSAAPFPDMKRWLSDEFVPAHLILGDRVVLFSFCGTAEKIADMRLSSDDDFSRLRSTIANLRPDGRFTDIGSAIDMVRETALGENPAVPYAAILCSDLIQEALYPSPYAGTYVFAERFLPPFKSIPHRLGGAASGKVAWYQLFLQLDDRKMTELSESLYAVIKESSDAQ